MQIDEFDDSGDSLAATQERLRRTRDTLIALTGAGLVALGVLGMHYDFRIGSASTTVTFYGAILAIGGVVAVVGVAMGLTSLLRRAG
jgi:hypothetical protein